IDKESVNWLIKEGFDSKMGARPLGRIIDREIKRPLAKLMLFGELRNGGVLNVNIKNDQIMLLCIPKEPKVPLLTVDSTDTVLM
ncbi:MAG: hypothetical protein RLZZ196_3490, partial [Bacteroidota bacterium]